MAGFKTKVTPEIENLTEVCKEHTSLDLSLYAKYDVKRGLRDINGKGVLAGLTQVSNVKATKIVDGKEVPCAGSLSYRGYDIKDLTRGFIEDDRYGFEEVTYLLLFGSLPVSWITHLLIWYSLQQPERWHLQMESQPHWEQYLPRFCLPFPVVRYSWVPTLISEMPRTLW